MVLRGVAVFVVRTNTTGVVSRPVLITIIFRLIVIVGATTFDDLAAAFGAFGVFFPTHNPITTVVSKIWIGARAEVQASTKAEIISIPAQSIGWLVVNSHPNSHTGKSQYLPMINHDVAKANQ